VNTVTSSSTSSWIDRPGHHWSSVASPDGLLSRRAIRTVLGIFWLLDGAVQIEPAKFASNYPLVNLAQSVMGAPGWVNRSIFAGIQPFDAHWAIWNLGAGLIEIAIGLSLITGKLTRLALSVSFLWAVTIWWLGEGFGMLPSGFATLEGGAPGSALLYVLVGTLSWPTPDHRGVNQLRWGALWSTLWVGGAVLQLPFVYPSSRVLRATLAESSAGEPSGLAATSSWFAKLVAYHGGPILVVLTLAELAIGVGWLIDHRHVKIWLTAGIALSLFFWVVFQQLGAVLTTGGTDPGSGPLMVLLALCAWPSAPGRPSGNPPVDAGHQRLRSSSAAQMAERDFDIERRSSPFSLQRHISCSGERPESMGIFPGSLAYLVQQRRCVEGRSDLSRNKFKRLHILARQRPGS
jgi:hypothetical protein